MGYQRGFNWDLIAVSITFFLISFVPFTSMYYCYIPWLTFNDNNQWLWTIPFMVFVISIWINYLLAMFVHPGKIPNDYHPDKMIHNYQPKFKHRWCEECQNYKPPRAHHCRYCNSCILKMDHHCPWVNTCIGYRNHGYFLRFVYSVTLASTYGLFLFVWRTYDLIRYQNQLNELYNAQSILESQEIMRNLFVTQPSTFKELMYLCIDAILMFVLCLTVGGLSVYQTIYVKSGITTIESFELEKIEDLVTRDLMKPRKSIFPYDLGWYENLKVVLGDSVWNWAFPFGDVKILLANKVFDKIKKDDKKIKSDKSDRENLLLKNQEESGEREGTFWNKRQLKKRKNAIGKRQVVEEQKSEEADKFDKNKRVEEDLVRKKAATRAADGKGFYYKVNEHYQQKNTVIWPPLEYFRYRNDPNWNGEEIDTDEESDGYFDDNDYLDDDDDDQEGKEYDNEDAGQSFEDSDDSLTSNSSNYSASDEDSEYGDKEDANLYDHQKHEKNKSEMRKEISNKKERKRHHPQMNSTQNVLEYRHGHAKEKKVGRAKEDFSFTPNSLLAKKYGLKGNSKYENETGLHIRTCSEGYLIPDINSPTHFSPNKKEHEFR